MDIHTGVKKKSATRPLIVARIGAQSANSVKTVLFLTVNARFIDRSYLKGL